MSLRYAAAVLRFSVTSQLAFSSSKAGRPALRKLQAASRLACALVLLGVLFGGAFGCHRNIEPFVEGEEPQMPNLARIFPEKEASSPSEAASAAPPRMPSAPQRGNLAAAPSAGIRGTIAISPELAAAAPPTGTLFVIARKSGTAGGPPLAVLRIPGPQFPVAFEIGQAQVMIPGLQFEGEIQLTARLDSDGNAMTKLPGDLSGAAPGVSSPGADGVAVLLDSLL